MRIKRCVKLERGKKQNHQSPMRKFLSQLPRRRIRNQSRDANVGSLK